MLALARAEPVAALQENFQPVASSSWWRSWWSATSIGPIRAGIDLGAEALAATVTGDMGLLEDLLENLIDNALKYTPSGGHVTVRSGMVDAAAYLEVEDDGPGHPRAERTRVRERFYRRPGIARHRLRTGPGHRR